MAARSRSSRPTGTPGSRNWRRSTWRRTTSSRTRRGSARPDVVERAFRPEFDSRQWESDKSNWRAWCDGMTGYPLVDAAMRELNATGLMHNRLRMVTASPWEMDLRAQQAAVFVIGRDYPAPVVRHETARRHALARYAAVKAAR